MPAVHRSLPIRRAAVLGAGVMGRGIAAHLAGAGIEVDLLDIVPPDVDPDNPADRNRFSAGGLKAALKNKPALFYDKADAGLITVGNFDDDLARLAKADWIVEVVKEDLDIKKALFARVEEHRKPGALMSSNTSGLPLEKLIEGRSDDFAAHFIITHFFNPVRYMNLLEVVSGPQTADGLVEGFTVFAREQLGKGVVFAKDSPAFIANRIGTWSLMYTVHKMVAEQKSPEFVDAIFGKATGRPKSAVFNTADVVGLDTLCFVSQHLYEDVPGDPERETFKIPDYFQILLDNGWLGRKTKQGFYKKVGKDILTYDPYAGDYRPKEKPRFDSLGKARRVENPAERLATLLSVDDEASQFAWDCVAKTLIYAANRLGEVSDDLVQIDNGMKWGFGHDLGPFETWDALGVEKTVERMKADGYEVPGWVTEMLASGRSSFYQGARGQRDFWDALGSDSKDRVAPEIVSSRVLFLPASIKDPRLVEKQVDARLWDIGDGVLCLEKRTKMNAVNADVIAMMHKGVEIAERDFEAMIIANHGNPGEGVFGKGAFSAGADLMSVMMGIMSQAFDQIGEMITGFQQANMKMRHSRIPVVAAPYDLTLGGGAEICLGANAIQAHPELYMGLVELGVGLIPGGGGCFGLLHNIQSGAPADADPATYVREAFLAIGMAKVSGSAEEARKLGFLRANDRITMDRDEHLYAAKQRALGMARSDFRPPRPRTVKAAGRSGYATLYSALWGMKETHNISEYDLHIGSKLAKILSGGDVAAGTVVSEARFLELEHEAFLSLCGEQKTLERIQYMLQKNKPLRN